MENRFHKMISSIQQNKGIVNISGLSEGRTAPLFSLMAKSAAQQTLVITSSQSKARTLCEDMMFFLEGEREILLMPEEERTPLNFDARSRSLLEDRMKCIIALAEGRPCVIVACITSVMRRLMPAERFTENVFTISADLEIDPELLKEKLGALGYERSHMVEARGQFSIRGDIVDIFMYGRENPVRVELFGDTVESLREFSVETQRSIRNLQEIHIYPAQQVLYSDEEGEAVCRKIEKAYSKGVSKLEGEAAERLNERGAQLTESIRARINNQGLSEHLSYFYDEVLYLPDYMGEESLIIVEDYERARERLLNSDRDWKETMSERLMRGEIVDIDAKDHVTADEFSRTLQTDDRRVALCTPFTGTLKGIDRLSDIVSVSMRAVPEYGGRMELLLEDLQRYKSRDFEIILVCSVQERADNIKNFLKANDFYGASVVMGTISAGSEFTEERLVYISDNDIFKSRKNSGRRRSRRKSQPIKSFVDIRPGDYVVHENHGIGRFEEIRQLEIEGIRKDYLMIRYAGDDVLYVSVDQMDSVQKYVGGDETKVKINRLSGQDWNKTKKKVRTAIQQMAREIMELSAQRRAIKGHAFDKDTVWQQEFEEAFPYVETEDQLRCTEEIKHDMEQPSPMERLLCGDVGFGKTEVAARAVFKCLIEGKQAAILVPTTILAAQHYTTFKERLEAFPFNVEMLCRFRTDKEQTEIVKKLKKGSVDLIIGTHRLLSSDIEFNDLGLLIIDEEQRFGVKHKEAIKLMRKNIDVLSLSATPIPRTLHMSLIGARDMSVIEEAPEDRYPVQTYVMEQDDDIIRNAIMSELDRGGQVFVVFNRVKEIRKVAAHIGELVPEARISVGHGRMNEESLENIIVDFVEHRSDILVCTTIIETGIDMPNANTMIILDADRFGLSQLYQLRGRVGRSDRLAYAYLMYRKDKVLSETAAGRLSAIRDFTELGAGFRIAMRDLELRGAGNILGTEQSGHMVTVGYELYCKMLDETMRMFRNEELPEDTTEVTIDLKINAYVPEKYIRNEAQRIEIYQKIASTVDEEDRSDLIDELIDRYGDIPKEIMNLLCVVQIKAAAAKIGVEKVAERGDLIVFEFADQGKLKPQMVSGAVVKYGQNVSFSAGRKPLARYKVKSFKNKAQEIADFAETLAQPPKVEKKSKSGTSSDRH